MEPPEEATAFKPGAAIFEKDDGYRLISRRLLYDKKFENYIMRFIDGDTLQERLDECDNALHNVSMRGILQTKL